MKSSKPIDIKVTAYFNAAGDHVCAIDFGYGDVCQYYRTKSYGTRELCVAVSGEHPLHRGGEQDGYLEGFLVPGDWCPLKQALEEGDNYAECRRKVRETLTRDDYACSDYADSVKEVVRTAKQWAGSRLPEPISIFSRSCLLSSEEEQLLQAVMDLDG